MLNSQTPGTDDYTFTQLGNRLSGGLERYQKLRSHAKGTAIVIDGGNSALSDAYSRFLRLARLNMADLIATTTSDRMRLVGFRAAGASDDAEDLAAMDLWATVYAPMVVSQAFDDVCTYGVGYALVGRDASTEDVELAHGEPWNTAVLTRRSTPWKVESALTYVFDEELKHEIMELYRLVDGKVYVRVAYRESDSATLTEESDSWSMPDDWQWLTGPQELAWAEGVVPVVPALAPEGEGQFEKHTDSLDRINHSIFQRLCIVVMQAFRQRAVKGNLPDTYPQDDPLGRGGQEVPYDEIFKTGPAALWRLPLDAEVWESSVTDITPLLGMIKDDVKHLAAVTKTPLYVLVPDAQTGSAQGASLARETLVFKVEKLCTFVDPFVSQVISLLLRASGGHRESGRLSAIWAPADRSSIAERAQSASQLAQALPKRTIWREILNFSPSQIAQAEQDAADDQFMEDGGYGEPNADRGPVQPESAGDDPAAVPEVAGAVVAADAEATVAR